MLARKPLDKELAEIRDELRNLTAQVGRLEGERDAVQDEIALQEKINELERSLTTKQIEYDREQEKWAREKREVQHMVGLEKARAEQERDLATREARLDVREAATDDKIATFTERLEFIQASLEKQINYLKDDIIKEVFKRLPVVEVNKNLEFGGNGNGHKAEIEV